MYEFSNKKELESPFYTYYEIKKGDTLYKIAKDFNMNPKLIAELNGFEIDDYIYPGQTLLIPKKEVSYYITKEGDTLNTISNIFNNKVEEIIKQNETIYILPGQMIYYKN
ncbi:MAG: LysM peptidoglycan-binding domain-containing protein [Bacilli bacterium]|nr:LysM peptidoglycan-binding domain-containing protein [Bacilli bacterium]